MSLRKTIGLGAGVALWVACLATGFAALQRYSAKSGPAHAPRDAAQFLATHRAAHRPLLVMAVHPRCPCSEASLAEMGDLLARSHGACDALLLQFHPEQDAADWPKDAMPTTLGGVAVKVVLDRGGKTAAMLGAATSGHVFFADADGALRFNGGLTIGRGHRGRAPAQDAILEILHGGQATLTSAPVYGCTLEAACAAPLHRE